MITHHPPDEWLLGLAAGQVPEGAALVLRVHAAGCAHCRERLRLLQAVGGELLEASPPELLAPEALARTLERIDATAGEPAAAPNNAPPQRPTPTLPMPAGTVWPAALKGCDVSRWRWMAPGLRWARLRLRRDPSAALFLLRIAPGMSLARHTHGQIEFTQVLGGSFDDGRAVFGPGDFDAADDEVRHQPVVLPGGECVCLAYVEGRLRYESQFASLVGRWMGM